MPGIIAFIGDNKFLIGDYPTFVDFFFFETLNLLRFITGDEIWKPKPGLFGGDFVPYDKLEKYYYRVRGLPGLSEYYEADDCIEHELTFNNKSAKRYI